MKQIGTAILRPRWAWLKTFGVRECYVRIYISDDGVVAANLAAQNWYKYNAMMRFLYRCELLT